MIDQVGQMDEIFDRIDREAEEFLEIERQKEERVRLEKERILNSMSPEKRQIVECVDKAMNKQNTMFCKLSNEQFVKEHCIYKLCKERNIQHERPSSRMNNNTEDSINIVYGFAFELLDEIEVQSWNVELIITDLYRYDPKKSQPAIEKIRRVPNHRAVNPLLKALKKSKKHHELIYSALKFYIKEQDIDLNLYSDKDIVEWSAKYALINLCLQPYTKNHRVSELVEAVPEFAKFIAKVGKQLNSADPQLRIVGVKHIGADKEFLEILKRISYEDPDEKVRDATRVSLRRNHKIKVQSVLNDPYTEYSPDEDTNTESYSEINRRDFEAQIEENEEYMDDIIAGLYR
ncbi:hypothetical protein Metbo_2160 [Methanobacterium lacus]|uniref:Uncharacterized protein n=1 Tax=Methanobacterium lacus (strain AL-21) TaxID=877455 RepID=F0TCA8_METLA|nr:hypothetical protein [Methanobacterium lacus]ADZ10375.1 hypothetical protein Metbo_2160 [Methanobacterium lacus]